MSAAMNEFLSSPADVRSPRRVSARLDAVQSPVIPVVAEMIRAHPGTISLGQGVVAYGNGTAIGPARRVVVTAGGNMAFMNAVLAITDPGDEVILPTPYYFNQEMAVTMAGCTPVLVPTDEGYQLRLDAIEAAVTPR